jgi:hypothetical protein
MAEYQVTCIRKPHHQSMHEHITHIGNLAEKWLRTRETVIQQIDGNVSQFYTVDKTSGKKCYVAVVREAGKHPYLRTHADGKYNDNLLAQTECDSSCRLL